LSKGEIKGTTQAERKRAGISKNRKKADSSGPRCLVHEANGGGDAGNKEGALTITAYYSPTTEKFAGLILYQTKISLIVSSKANAPRRQDEKNLRSGQKSLKDMSPVKGWWGIEETCLCCGQATGEKRKGKKGWS